VNLSLCSTTKNPVSEINEKTDIFVIPKYKKQVRKIAAIKFEHWERDREKDETHRRAGNNS
jgi:plasmid replication initiation protein